MSHEKLRGFISEIAQLVDTHLPEAQLLEQGAAALGKLIAEDDWLPDAYAQPSPDRYHRAKTGCSNVAQWRQCRRRSAISIA